MTRFNTRHRLLQNCGFSLIELIGVLSIIAILAAVITPNVITQIDIAAQDAEAENLRSLESGLRQYIKTSKTVPDESSWASAIATQINRSPTQVSSNDRNYSRIFVYDQTIDPSIPYTQSPTGFGGTLANLRFMIISHLGQDIGSSYNSGNLDSQAGAGAFAAVWDQSGQPAGLTEGGDLLIQRINLTDLFHTLTLNNNDTISAFYDIDASAATAIAAGTSVTLQIIHGSQLHLLDSSGTSVEYSHTLTEAASFIYLGGWGSTLGPAVGGAGSNIIQNGAINFSATLAPSLTTPASTSCGTAVTLNVTNNDANCKLVILINGACILNGGNCNADKDGGSYSASLNSCDLVTIMSKEDKPDKQCATPVGRAFYMPDTVVNLSLP